MNANKRIGVVLAGSGVFDGSEIHEAVITLLALDRAQAQIIMMAPNVPQMHVIDHQKGQPAAGETRHVLTEAARIARGEVKDIAQITANDLDGLVFPGGYGAAKNLCDFAVKGVDCSVNPEVARLIKEMHAAKKPMGFICIAPVLAAKVLGQLHPELTIGNDAQTAEAIEKMGGKHVTRRVDEIAEDSTHKIISTPAYMLGPSISHVAQGIEKLVARLIKLA